eukprot:CAMPEP_0179987450 /NCGR_PEP_ID=MMETSP0984-20121128/2784_1 /TAXON_ID=483367 /ORGANISM="non described non described, Strain CCMP 2436" /LENGTH=72 /DNA_ID=CAMNT_0021906327 /DNA_START=839 /DNA_END=1054 /DNA_ORIENTATION=-
MQCATSCPPNARGEARHQRVASATSIPGLSATASSAKKPASPVVLSAVLSTSEAASSKGASGVIARGDAAAS